MTSARTDAPDGRFTAIAAGEGYSCAVSLDGSIECWGQIGVALEIPPEGPFTAISASLRHACAVRVDRTVACWSPIRPPPPEVTFH